MYVYAYIICIETITAFYLFYLSIFQLLKFFYSIDAKCRPHFYYHGFHKRLRVSKEFNENESANEIQQKKKRERKIANGNKTNVRACVRVKYSLEIDD